MAYTEKREKRYSIPRTPNTFTRRHRSAATAAAGRQRLRLARTAQSPPKFDYAV